MSESKPKPAAIERQKEDVMSKGKTVYAVSVTATYPSSATKEEVLAGERPDWDSVDTFNVLAGDAEQAILRAKAHIDARDQADKSYAKRLSLAVNGVREVVTIDVG